MTKSPKFAEKRPVANRDEIETYIANRPPVELNLARGIVSRAVIVGPIMVAIFAIFKGLSGAIAAALGVAMVVAYYLFTGWILSMTARVSLATYYAGALFGFVVRLVLIGVTMAVLANQFDVDKVALGATVAATYVTLLMWEAATFKRVSDRESSARREIGR
jgi:hypothetical protein